MAGIIEDLIGGLSEEALGYFNGMAAGETARANAAVATGQRIAPAVFTRKKTKPVLAGANGVNRITDNAESIPAIDNGYRAISDSVQFQPETIGDVINNAVNAFKAMGPAGIVNAQAKVAPAVGKELIPGELADYYDEFANKSNEFIYGRPMIDRIANPDPVVRDDYGAGHDVSSVVASASSPQFAQDWSDQNTAFNNAYSDVFNNLPVGPVAKPPVEQVVSNMDEPADIPEKAFFRRVLSETVKPAIGAGMWATENIPGMEYIWGDPSNYHNAYKAVEGFASHPAAYDTEWGAEVGEHAGNIGSSAAQMGIAALLPGNPEVNMGIMAGLGNYAENRSKGVDPLLANIAAAANGYLETKLEQAGGGLFAGPRSAGELFGALRRGAVGDVLHSAKSGVKGLAKEVGTELPTSWGQNYLDVTVDPNRQKSDVRKVTDDTIIDTLGLSAGIGAPVAVANTANTISANKARARQQQAMDDMRNQFNNQGFPMNQGEMQDVISALNRQNMPPAEQAAKENPTANASELGKRSLDILKQRKREDATVRKVNERANANVLNTGNQFVGQNVADATLPDNAGNNVLMDYVNAVKNARIYTTPTGDGSGPELTAEENSGNAPEMPDGAVRIDGRVFNVPGRKGVTVDHINERIKDNEALQASTVVQSVTDLPQNIQDEINEGLKAQGMEGRTDLVEGFVGSDGNSYIIGDNLTPERVEDVARHETIGHYGLQGMMEETEAGSYERLMNDISSAIESNKTLQNLRDEVLKSQPNITGMKLAEEIAAKMAEKNMQNSFTQRIFGAIRRFLKKMRLIKGDVTDAQLSKYLRDSQKWLANNSAIKSGPMIGRKANMQKMQPAFSVAENSDQQYMNAVKSGDTETASRMVREQAKAKGYSESEHKGWHESPKAGIAKEKFTDLEALRKELDDGGHLNLYALANDVSMVPDDFFDYSGYRYYANDSRAAGESIRAIRPAMDSIREQMEQYGEVRKMPEVTVYRAVPNTVAEGKLRSEGEWVSPSRAYVKEHGESRFGKGEYKIIKENVSAENLWFDGNDINEWGFDDGNKYMYQNTKNNRKLTDAVTYDNKGNPIPLSKRFDSRKSDARFSLSEEEKDKVVEEIFKQSQNEAINDELDRLNKIIGVSKEEILNDVRDSWTSEFERRRGKIGKSKDIYKKDIFDVMKQRWLDYRILDKIEPDGFHVTTDLNADASVDANIQHGRDAIRKSIFNRMDIDNAMYRSDAGWIDFKWGQLGNIKINTGKTDGGAGVYHIIFERLRKDGITEDKVLADMDKIIETIAKGKPDHKQTFENPNANVRIVYGDSGVVLSRDENKKAWMLTGWGDKPGAWYIAVHGADAATHSVADPDDDKVGAGVNSNINQKESGNNTLGSGNNSNFSLSETKKENEGRVLNREPGSFTAREQEVFDDFMSKRADADRNEGSNQRSDKGRGNRIKGNFSLLQDGKIVRNGLNRNSDSTGVRVVEPTIDIPEFKRIADLSKWLKTALTEVDGTVEIESTGQIARFSKGNIGKSLKRARSEEHRKAYGAIKDLVRSAEYDHFEPTDERHPNLGGQDVYLAALNIPGKDSGVLYAVQIKLDVPSEAENNARANEDGKEDVRYKDHRLKEIVPTLLSRSDQNGVPSQTAGTNEVSLGVLRNTVNTGNFSLAQDQGGFFVPDITVADNIIRSLQDQDVDIKRVQDAILRAGGAITDESDVYLNKTLYISKVADRLERMNKEFTDPILTLINESKVSYDEASDWLYARHVYLDDVNNQLASINEGATIDDALSGMEQGEAESLYKKHSGNKKLQEMADLVDKLMRRNVNILVNSGLLTPEEANSWSKKKHYVPLFRDNLGIRSETAMERAKKWWKARGNPFKVKAERNGPTGGTPKAGGVETRGKESRRRMGSKTRATNILGNVFASATAGIMRSQKQETAHAVLQMAKDNPNPDFWTVDKPETVKRINKQTGFVEVTYRDANLQPANHVFVVKVDGVEHWIVFNKDNARAMEMCKALKASDAPQLMWITQAVGELTRWTGGWLTTHNPVFALFNFMRDQQHMLFNLEDTPLKGKQLQVMRNLPGAMKGVWEVTRGDKMNSKWAKYFDEFKRNGAETGFINNFSNINDRVADLKKRQKELARSNANPMKWWSSFMDLVDDYNGITENGTRLAVYITARENGLSEKQAARIAKEITVDFNRKGQRSSMLNSVYMFTNANIQGHARMFRAMKNSKRARWIAVAMMGIGAGLAYVSRMLMGRDPETDEDKYDEISDFEKTTNWIFPIDTKGNYIKIPIAQGLHVLPSIGRIAMDTIISLINDNSKDAKQKAMSVVHKLMAMVYVTADAFNPLGSAGSPIQLATPSVFRPAVQIYENKSFTGAPLRRDDAPYNGYNAPAYQKAFKKTQEHWVNASKLLNDLTGGDDVKPGKLNVAPETLRLLFSSVFMPGMSANIDRALGSIERSQKGRDVRPDEMPVLNRVYGKAPNENLQESKYHERMNEMSQKSEQAKQYYKKYKDFLKKANKQAEDFPETIPELKAQLEKHKERYTEALKEMGDGNAKLGAARIMMMDKLGKKVSELRRKSTIAERDGHQDEANKLDDERMKVMKNFIKGGNNTDKLLAWYDRITQK